MLTSRFLFQVPNTVVPWSKKMEVYEKGLQLLKEVHAEHGWKGAYM